MTKYWHTNIVPKVDRNVAAAIAKGRAAKELNQKEFAVKINEPVKTVVEYEQGKAIPSQAILGKMERVLGVRLVCFDPLNHLPLIIWHLFLELIAIYQFTSHPTCLYFLISFTIPFFSRTYILLQRGKDIGQPF